MKSRIFMFFLMVAPALPTYGQFSDDIFSTMSPDDLISEPQESEEAIITKDVGFFWSGSLNFGLSLNGYYDIGDGELRSYSPSDPNNLENLLGTNFSGSLTFAATNESFVDLYGRFTLDPTADASNGRDLFTLRSLYTKFDIESELFFKMGKFAVDWGVGAFFTPTDVINLTTIDPHDADADPADIEGPVNVKMGVPLGLNYLAVYAILGDNLGDSGGAARFDFLISNIEFGLGLYYRNGSSPVATLKATGAVGQVNWYLGSTLAYGSDNPGLEWTDPSDTALGATQTDRVANGSLYPRATVGASYSISDDLGWYSFSFAGQYYFNGEGIFDRALADSAPGNFRMAENGLHYLGARIGWNGMFASDVSMNLTYTHNLSDGSLRITPNFTWRIVPEVSLRLGLPVAVGSEGSEYAPFGSSIGGSLTLSIGGGNF